MGRPSLSSSPFRQARIALYALIFGLAWGIGAPSAYADSVSTHVTGLPAGNGEEAGPSGTYDSLTGQYYKLQPVSEINPNTGKPLPDPQFKRFDLLSSPDGFTFSYHKTLVDAGDVTLFVDNFDNYGGEVNANWSVHAGTWQVAEEATNVFVQTDAGGGIASYAGGGDWTDYLFSADVKDGDGAAAILGRYRDAGHYYQLIVTGNAWRLDKRDGGDPVVLDEGSFAASAGDTYNLKLLFEGADIRAYIDGVQVSQTSDSGLAGGTVGLRADGGQARFDNVRVRQQMLLDDFEQGFGHWTSAKGSWQAYTETYASGNPDNVVYRETSGSGIAYAGSEAWTDYHVSAYVKQTGGGAALLGRYQDSTHYYQLLIKSDSWVLNKNVGGKWTTLRSGNYAFSSTKYYHLKMIFSGSSITAGIWDENGKAIINSPHHNNPVTVTDTSMGSGKIGLRTTGEAYFDNVNVGDVLSDAMFRSTGMIKSPLTGHWSIWTKRQYGTHGDGNLGGGGARHLASLTSMDGRIDGDYVLVYAGMPDGNPSGDKGIFTDDDENRSSYILSADPGNGLLHLYKLNPDRDNFDQSASRPGHKDGLVSSVDCSPQGINCYSVNGKFNLEAPSLLKRDGYYYIFGSGVSGWYPNQQQYTYAPSLSGPWAQSRKIGDASGFHSQLFSVRRISGTEQTSFLFWASRNGQLWGGPSTAVHLPMYQNNPSSTPDEDFSFSTNYYDYVTMNETTGEVKGHHYDIGTLLPVAGVSAAYDNGVNVPGNVADGSDATYWINDNTQAGGVLEFDLGSEHQIKAIKLKLDPDNSGGSYRRVSRIKVEVGDGTDYTTVYETDSDGIGGVTAAVDWLQPIHLQDATRSGQFVRVSLAGPNSDTSNNYTFKVYEAEIWGDTANAVPVVDDRFTDEAVGSEPAGWTIAADTCTCGKVRQDWGDHLLKLKDNSARGHVTAERSFVRQKGAAVVFSFDFMFSQVGTGDAIVLGLGAADALRIANTPSGLRYDDSLGSGQLLAPVDAGVWYRMRIEANTDVGTFDAYLAETADAAPSATPVRGGGRLAAGVNALDRLRFETSGSGKGEFLIDNVQVSGPLY